MAIRWSSINTLSFVAHRIVIFFSCGFSFVQNAQREGAVGSGMGSTRGAYYLSESLPVEWSTLFRRTKKNTMNIMFMVAAKRCTSIYGVEGATAIRG